CYHHVPKELRTKLQTTGKKGIFLGFTNTASLVLSLPEKQLIEVRTVVVNEGEFLETQTLKELGIGKSMNQSDIFPLDYTPEDDDTKMDVDLEPNIAENEGDENGIFDNIDEKNADIDMGDEEDLEDSDLGSESSSQKPNYVEDVVAWNPRFGRRFLRDEDDESWEEEEDSEHDSEQSNF